MVHSGQTRKVGHLCEENGYLNSKQNLHKPKWIVAHYSIILMGMDREILALCFKDHTMKSFFIEQEYVLVCPWQIH